MPPLKDSPEFIPNTVDYLYLYSYNEHTLKSYNQQ